MKKQIFCPICQESHEIDSTGWVQCQIGYYPKEVFMYNEHDAMNLIKAMEKMR